MENKKLRIAPDFIKELKENEVFVFGSNLAGNHLAGAAKQALKWGAVMGQGTGLQGQTYAIPTMQGPKETIEPYIKEFIEVAKENKHLNFLVTRIACGIAGFTDDEIAPYFAEAINIENIWLPKSFIEVILNK